MMYIPVMVNEPNVEPWPVGNNIGSPPSSDLTALNEMLVTHTVGLLAILTLMTRGKIKAEILLWMFQ